MKLRVLLIATATVLGISGWLAAPAHAASGDQWCYQTGGQACVNAWSGGPFVKVYTSRGVVNNDFTLIYNTNAQGYQLEFTGGGAWNGYCVGDEYNDPNNGYTSLDPCGLNGGEGWGTVFTTQTCASNAICFINRHWSGLQHRNDWLGPVNNWGNGSEWVLNSPNQDYIYIYPPA